MGGLFESFFQGGFECSTHRLRSGRRLDLVSSTAHDRFAAEDFARLRDYDIRTVREGVRWHLVETSPYRYDFSSALAVIRPARAAGMQVIWDLCHFGWPDGLDIFTPEFVRRFAGLARAFTQLLAGECDGPPFIAPVNEISFFAWFGGKAGLIDPYAERRGSELKEQLARAAIAATEAVWEVSPGARVVHVDPVINIIAHPSRPYDRLAADYYQLLQYEAWDMIAGRLLPQLGGSERHLDIVGVTYYPDNQWFYSDAANTRNIGIRRDDPHYRRFADILAEVYGRYRRPLLVAETGAEDDERPGWLRYVAGQAREAVAAGVPVEGVCLYPAVNFPGWLDDRHCHNGLWDYADDAGRREIYRPLADELRRLQSEWGGPRAAGRQHG